MQWFKFYGEEYLSDPKMLSLSPAERSCWITLLSYASVASSEGIVRHIDENKLMRQAGIDPMREEWNETQGVLEKFEKLGMSNADDNGMITIIHWQERQRIPLTSYERVKKWREKKRNDNADDNEMKRNDNAMITVEESRVEKSRVDNILPPAGGESKKDMKYHDERKHDSDYEEVIDADTREKIQAILPRTPTGNLMRWGEERLGKKFVNRGKQGKSITRMTEAGYTPEDIRACWLKLERDDFWKQKGIDFGVVSTQISKLTKKMTVAIL